MGIYDRHPELQKKFEILSQIRRNEILNYILETDNEYKKLVKKRAQASMKIKNIVARSRESDKNFENYSDAVYAQEIYELDVVYKQGFIDAIIDLYNNGLLNLEEE